ncbi:MAG: hypothetical protein HUJ51_03485 [Eggerthellaceae bacterium]|nr:hypothetical protein [Eggerthellaceae bacterium]
MFHLDAGLYASGKKVSRAFVDGIFVAAPISCALGHDMLCEIDQTNVCEVAGRIGDCLAKGLQESLKKYKFSIVSFNIGLV